VNNTLKVALLIAGLVGVTYVAARHRKKNRHSAWKKFTSAAEPDNTGINFNPAFVSTAATPDVLVSGEPDTGAINPGCFSRQSKKSGCGCS
jgi:hypothetical protein